MSEFYFDFEKQRPRISRREAIRRALFAASGLVLANHISFRAFAARANRPRQGRHPNLDVGRAVAHGHF